jgi:hypothetical protein
MVPLHTGACIFIWWWCSRCALGGQGVADQTFALWHRLPNHLPDNHFFFTTGVSGQQLLPRHKGADQLRRLRLPKRLRILWTVLELAACKRRLAVRVIAAIGAIFKKVMVATGGHQEPSQVPRKRPLRENGLFWSFPYVCPEPVLVK